MQSKSERPPSLGYVPALDGLRAVAILSVMAFHYVKPLMRSGQLGVDVFFVLSGWLITSILTAEFERSGSIDYRAFIGRRARRLLPALAMLLVAYVTLAPWLIPASAPGRWVDAAAATFYVTNLRETFWPVDTPLSHTWSLAIEEQFYLLWPWALLGLLRLPRRRVAAFLCVAWAVITLARPAFAFLAPSPAAYYFTPFHATGLMLGAALALYPLRLRFGGYAFAALCVLFFLGHGTLAFLALQPLAEIATVVIVADPPRLLAAGPLRFVGRISYGVYLWHIPVVATLRPHDFAGIGSAALASIVAGALSHFLVERWFLVRPHQVATKTIGRASPAGIVVSTTGEP